MSRIVDLTHPFNSQTTYWPTSPTTFKLEQLSYGPMAGGYFYAANASSSPEHGGTHLGAHIHFGDGRQTSNEIPLNRLMASAVVIDVEAATTRNPDYRLTTDDVLAFQRAHGAIRQGTIVLLGVGWSRFWPDRRAYLGDDTPNDASRLRFPSHGDEAGSRCR